MWDGIRRKGNPRSNAERKRRHKRLHGTSKLPPRGTGLRADRGFYGHMGPPSKGGLKVVGGPNA